MRIKPTGISRPKRITGDILSNLAINYLLRKLKIQNKSYQSLGIGVAVWGTSDGSGLNAQFWKCYQSLSGPTRQDHLSGFSDQHRWAQQKDLFNGAIMLLHVQWEWHKAQKIFGTKQICLLPQENAN